MTDKIWIDASQIVTPINGTNSLQILNDGAILIRDDKIAFVGNKKEAFSRTSSNVQIYRSPNCVILPGLVDAHTHIAFAGTREDEYEQKISGKTYKEIAEAGGGILRSVDLTRAATEEQLIETTKKRCLQFLEYGTTTIEAKSGYGLSLEDELKLLRVINKMNEQTPLEVIPTFLGAHETPREYRHCPDDYIDLLIDKILPKIAATNLAEYCDIFCEPHVFSLKSCNKYLEAARRFGFGLRVHVEQLSRSGGALLAARLSATTADHLEYAEEEDLLALKNANVFPVLLPGSVFHLGLKRYPPARRMIELGLPVVLATDFNPGSSPSVNLQMIMSLACTQMKLTPAEALTACTINAAKSLGRDSKIGSLEIGKQADFVTFQVSDYRQIPYFFGMNLVESVIKKGEVIFQKHKF